MCTIDEKHFSKSAPHDPRDEKMTCKRFIAIITCLTMPAVIAPAIKADTDRPNIIYIMADDLGYGDAAPFGLERSKVPTPGMTQLAKEGMRFTDAHSIASVCVPSRLAIMTGRYPWRIEGQSGSGPWGFIAPRFTPGHHTLAHLLNDAGYQTGYIGKWHLGLKMVTTDGKTQTIGNVDYAKPVKAGPNDHGFDYSFILPGSLDMYPYVYLRNQSFLGRVNKQRGWSAFNRVGPTEEHFEDYEVLQTFRGEVNQFIARNAKAAKSGNPFFLYFALTSPHTPTSPHPDFQGKTDIGVYGDFVYETDHCIVSTLNALKKHGLDHNTIVIFTSDHGPAPYAGNILKATYDNVKGLEAQGHYPAGPLRGYKFSVYEGGTRIPFLIKWPNQIKPGTTCDRLIGLNDLLATVADITDSELSTDQAVDSISYLPLLSNPQGDAIRTNLQIQGTHGWAYRMGDWKLCLCPGSGAVGVYGNVPKPMDAWAAAVKEFGKQPTRDQLLEAPFVQLFNLKDDLEEQHDLALKHPEIVQKMYALMNTQFANGRSTPGPQQENDRKNLNYWGRIPPGTLAKERNN